MKLKIIILIVSSLSQHSIFSQNEFSTKISDAAIKLTEQNVAYDPAYYVIPYPGGDIPGNKGVCTDLIIRAYRQVGVDLQKEVHEDMKANFTLYPDNWGLSHPDKNIDHRRVPNLITFFSRFGESKPVTENPDDYLPGDIVCWDLGGNIPHIGLVVNKKSSVCYTENHKEPQRTTENKVLSDGERFLIVHNIGNGQVLEDCLFNFKITGHYRYEKKKNF